MSSEEAMRVARACADQMYAEDDASKSLGITVEINAPGVATANMTIRADMVNGHNICHGGLIFTLADSAFAFACNCYDEITVAAGADINFARPAKLGDQLTAVASEIHRGKRAGVYDVVVKDQEGRLIAVFRGRSAGLGKPMIST